MTAEFWDNRYSHPNYFYGYRPNDFLKQQSFLLKPNSRVLCLGDGEGRNGVYLAGLGHRVVSLDFSRVALDKAAALAAEKGVELETWHVDLASWVHNPDPLEQWDGVVSIFVHLPPDLRRRVAQVVTRQSAPGAKLILEAYTPAQLSLGTGGPKDVDLLLKRDDVAADWQGWHLDVRLLERRIFEGMGHQGLSSVVQALGLRVG
ncbi:class I SAM-dependent methyltransferase [Tessaracoccus sp. MC1865]|uniref:class I SAM-dependent methyltransferase n=1 Tax=Tessaracoccus sp. MC1865 TaxID=2760310 RepID=UPI001600D534|nr:class I SAM-dependent methyltransferase [Tessaracoccus sp. MC1865]MBB1482277.1 class I SAM-dependent methyltransferase [Tessaracoccus sp. MC1865]QTO38252.1 class I SAM-dependent methyltransferase [Tessaracoccus sp. MC1865]